jgi:hypothetical protein
VLNSLAFCSQHHKLINRIQKMLSKPASEWLYKSHSGKHLWSTTKDLSQSGHWRILGEDSNPDFGGTHYQPTLAICYRKLEDVINYAVQLDGWKTWGLGGDIQQINMIIVDEKLNNELQKIRSCRAGPAPSACGCDGRYSHSLGRDVS